MIESDIRTYVEAKVQAAWPAIKPNQVIVRFPQGELIQTRNKSSLCLGSEVLSVELLCHTDDHPDRVALIRAFPMCEVTIGDRWVLQKYVRHRYFDLAEVSQGKRTAFYLSFTYDIFEE